MKTTHFVTHTGEVVSGERLQAALDKVALAFEVNAQAIYKEDAYASHVTAEQKLANLTRGLDYAESIRQGAIRDLTAAQRLNTELTGECVPLLAAN